MVEGLVSSLLSIFMHAGDTVNLFVVVGQGCYSSNVKRLLYSDRESVQLRDHWGTYHCVLGVYICPSRCITEASRAGL